MSSTDIFQRREALRRAYVGPSWQAKVDKMSDQQVIAVYLRLKLNNKV